MPILARGRSRLAEEWSRQQMTVLSGLAGGWDEVTELLEQARRRLRTDEAALLLLDTSGTMLVPVAALGLDRPGHSGFRVPVGEGFAGRVSATDRPVVLTDVRPETVLNPALHRAGIKSLLGVPVTGPAGPLGVVHVGSVGARDFTKQDTVELEQLAAQLAVEVLRRRVSEEHIAALALQRSLLPTAPTVDGLDVAARYVPADGDLGGDWYDLFQLPGERIGIVMGDVAGHGLPAAVIMGRLRSALRAYALEHADPAHVLRLLDMKISYFEAGAVATVLYAVAEPPYNRFAISSAGHLPPYLVLADGSVSATDVIPDPPLGVRAPSDDPWSRLAVTVAVPVGASLCMFTDGLVERRPAPGEGRVDQLEAGLRRLVEALRPGDADTACDAILNDLVGDDITEDDIAVLVLRPLTA
ncbi:MAG TPA: GAF domain-containing SpoIIE family protein phosphatase [Acidothermaceae bacterium]|jgi:serine phosphatase RsbU (regulator of sigma subunit)